MAPVSDKTLRQLDAVNTWLKDVFGEDIRLSVLLTEVGLSESDNEAVKSKHLTAFIQAVVDLIANNTVNHDGERRNNVMVRHYGLINGKPETLQFIGDSLELSRERIRQLVEKRIRLYSSAKRKEQFKADVAAIARELLGNDENEFG